MIRFWKWPFGATGLAVLLGAAIALLLHRWLPASGQPLSLPWFGNGIILAEPRALLLLSALPLLWVPARRSLANLPRLQLWAALWMRATLLLLLIAALAMPTRKVHDRSTCGVALIDTSASMSDPGLEAARAWTEKYFAARDPSHQVEVVAFARRPHLLALEPSTRALPTAKELRALASGAGGDEASDYTAALQLAIGLCPQDRVKRVVLLGDGLETEGDLLTQVARLHEQGVTVHVVPTRTPLPADVAVRDLILPESIEPSRTFSVVARLHATRPASVTLRLRQNQTPNALDPERRLDLPAGNSEVSFKSVVEVPGPVRYRLTIEPQGPDRFAQNNAAQVSANAMGRPTVLYVLGEPSRATPFASALRAQSFDVDVRSTAAFPRSLAELDLYDFLVLDNVAREQLGQGPQDLIARFVRELGGGLLFSGGSRGFELGGWSRSSLERLLPVNMEVSDEKQVPQVAMVLVIDRSGSMSGLPLEMAKSACKATVATLGPDDRVEVVAFDSSAVRAVPLQPARFQARIRAELSRIVSGGGTEIFPALDMAYQDIAATSARRKHIVLLTDGQSPTHGLDELVQALVADSITLTTVGLGSEADAELLRRLAEAGGGRYHGASTPKSLPRIFTHETELVSREAASDEWFSVHVVHSASFLRGVAIGSAPLLHGYVSTTPKPAPAQVVLASDRGEPILARMRQGLGWTLAFTSDLGGPWAVDWVRWSAYPRLFGQLVREHLRQRQHREVAMQIDRAGSTVTVSVDAYTDDDRFDNDLAADLKVEGPRPKELALEQPLRQTAPGRYSTSLQIVAPGSYRLTAYLQRLGADGRLRQVAESHGRLSFPYPVEFARLQPDLDRLKAAAMAGAGRVDPSPEEVLSAGSESVVRKQPLWSRPLLLALMVLILDLLVRRANFRLSAPASKP